MSDHDPRLDKPNYEDVAFEPRPPSRGLYLVVGVVAAIIGGDRPDVLLGPSDRRKRPGPQPGSGSDRYADQRDADAVRSRGSREPATPTPEPVTPAPSQQP